MKMAVTADLFGRGAENPSENRIRTMSASWPQAGLTDVERMSSSDKRIPAAKAVPKLYKTKQTLRPTRGTNAAAKVAALPMQQTSERTTPIQPSTRRKTGPTWSLPHATFVSIAKR